MKKKVIWIVNEYSFPDEPITRQSILCRLLNEKGYDCYIISGSTHNKGLKNRLSSHEKYRYVKTSEAKGYLIRTSDYQNRYQRVLVAIQFQHRLWRLRKKIPHPDIIVSDFAGLFGNTLLKWKKKYGTKIIFDILDLWPEAFVSMGYMKKESLIAKYFYALEHKSYREADGIIFSFQGGRDYIINKGWSTESGGDVDTRDIGYLNNGVDLALLEKQSKEYILDDLDLHSDKFKIIYLGSVSEFNGLDVLVEVAKELQERKENHIIILIYGYGNREETLKRMALRYNLSNILFKGKLAPEYGMSLLKKSDLNLFTFKKTSLLEYGVSPNKLFMYFASGKPILSMIKPKYDLIEKYKAGISVDNSISLIADSMVEFSKMDQSTYNTYCKNARKIAEEYDYNKLVEVLLHQIEKEKL